MNNEIKLIVGLGNPGDEYKNTRHNVGFWFIDALLSKYNSSSRMDKKFSAEVARLEIVGKEVRLLKPQTFMNCSGQAVSSIANFFKIAPDEILVVHDELDIPVGTLKFKKGGGNGGHNGLKDIQNKIGSADFWRLRLGISHPGDKNKVTSYVLKNPPDNELKLIEHSIERVLDEINTIVIGDFSSAMSKLHGK